VATLRLLKKKYLPSGESVGQFSSSSLLIGDHQANPYETRNIAAEAAGVVEQLLPLLKLGNTGIMPDFESGMPAAGR
jgi:hypothetical protein